MNKFFILQSYVITLSSTHIRFGFTALSAIISPSKHCFISHLELDSSVLWTFLFFWYDYMHYFSLSPCFIHSIWYILCFTWFTLSLTIISLHFRKFILFWLTFGVTPFTQNMLYFMQTATTTTNVNHRQNENIRKSCKE